MTTLRRTLLPWGATLLLLALCLLPKSWMPRGEATPKAVPHLDKVIHFVMFAGFGLIWVCAGPAPLPTRTRAAGVLAAAFALAVGTELAQGLPQIERDPDVFDALADAAGAAAGVGVGAVVAWGTVRGGGGPRG